MRWSIALVLALAGTAGAAPRAQLVVDGDACALADVGGEAARLLGGAPFDDAATAVVRVDVARTGDGVRAEVTLVDADGTRTGPRTLAAPDCARLAADLPIVIATVVRSLPERRPPPPPPAPPPTTPIAASERVVERVVERLDEAPAPVRSARTSLAVVVGVGVGERIEEVAGLRVRRGRGSLLVEARRGAADGVTVIPGAAGVDIAPSALDLVPCVHAGPVAACAVLSAGWFAGTSSGLVHVDSARLPLVAAGGRLAAEYHLTAHVGLAVRTEVRCALSQAQFQVDHMTVWTSPRLEAGAGIDLFAQIP